MIGFVCCCVCMQRAKRKGREEALASVENHQRRTQARELAEHQRYQPSQQTSYQPPVTGYSQPLQPSLWPNHHAKI
ncbi:hypothetical protein Plhal703r1_c03g0014231 [Plasmopara halstedii]